MCVVVIGNEIPRETVGEYRRCSDRQLQAGVSGFRSVEIEEDVARCIASPDVVYDLVFGLLAIDRRVDTKPVVKEAQLGAELVRLGKFRLQIQVRPGKAVPVSAKGCVLNSSEGRYAYGRASFPTSA